MRTLMRESLVVLAIMAAMAGAAWFLIFRGQSGRLEQVQAETLAQKTTLLSEGQKASVVPDMVRQVREMKERYKDLDRKVPERTELGGFLREINTNLAQENLHNQLIEPGSPTQEELFHTLPIIMKFHGSYLSMAGLLKRIDRMERLARVQKLKIDSDSKTGDLDIEVQLSIYFTDKGV